MRYARWARVRVIRFLTILLTTVAYIALLLVDASSTFSHRTIDSIASLLVWQSFGFSAFAGLIFLSVAILVWLYAHDRLVAFFLYCFSCSITITFTLLTGSGENSTLAALAGISGVLCVPLLSILVLLFPRNHLFLRVRLRGQDLSRIWQASGYTLLLCAYLMVLIVVGLLFSGMIALEFFGSFQIPLWLKNLRLIYFAIGLSGVLSIVIASYRQSSSLRARQQIRLFVCGVVLAVAPLLLLTVLPQVLHLPAKYIVDGQFTALTLSVFPVTLGYSILRYQILVFDRYIRRAVAWVVGVVSLAVLVYLTIALHNILFVSSGGMTLYLVSITGLTVILAPCIWWLAKVITERLFFSEILYYRRLIEKSTTPIDETLDLEEASRLLTLAAVHAFETQQACLFVLDESSGHYRIYPTLKEHPSDAARRTLIRFLYQAMKLSTVDENSDWLNLQPSLMEYLLSTRRPLLLSEVVRRSQDTSLGLHSYLTTAVTLNHENLLIAPVRAQGKMIGVLVLGERGDHEPYAGPDFDIVQLILARFSSILETARLYLLASQHASLLNHLYSASTMPGYKFKTIEDVAHVYASVAAEAVMASAEIWFYDEANKTLQRVVSTGVGPFMTDVDTLRPSQDHDWSPWFHEGETSENWREKLNLLPSVLSQSPCFPLAWLPLQKGKLRLGVLVLTYPRRHLFMKEEARVLEMFASQCTAALENAKMTIELRLAYERQKELDRLKDQFIVTASHELRTPLTAVQGYIELLNEYNTSLSVESRANFIAKAHRGCDELALMVGNIMDASRVRIDAENVKLSPISLLESVSHVLEILEAMTKREQRTVVVDIAPDVLVLADDMRLRQVLLNLVSNALKYSPAGANVEIRSRVDGKQVMVSVRDFGLGVPVADQSRLFERFVRLDRDMNSPVRGAGLGLYICKQLIEAMGGRIWMESSGRSGDGSTFAFMLSSPRKEQK